MIDKIVAPKMRNSILVGANFNLLLYRSAFGGVLLWQCFFGGLHFVFFVRQCRAHFVAVDLPGSLQSRIIIIKCMGVHCLEMLIQ